MRRLTRPEIDKERAAGRRDFARCELAGGASHSLDRLNMADCNLQGAVFEEELLDDACFEDCDLSGARFVQCYLGKTSFRRARLGGANFLECTFIGTDFTEADLRGATFDSHCWAQGPGLILTRARYDPSLAIPKPIETDSR